MRKLKKQNGFTLVEMLIVVAIIAILIAVSIPMVGSALERSREATDAANERAFKAALMIGYLNGEVEKGKPYCYNAVEGTIKLGSATGEPYGRGRAGTGADTLNDHKDCYLWGHIGSIDPATKTMDDSVYMGWNNMKTLTDSATDLGKIDMGTLTGMYLQN